MKGKYLGQHIFLVTICVVFLLVLALALLIPSQRRIQNLEQRIAATEAEVEEQKILYPVYSQLLAEKARVEGEGLPPMQEGAFSQEDLAGLWDTFEGLAREAGLETVSVQPVSTSVSDRVQVNGIFTGPLEPFRGFLVQLGTFGYVEHLQEVLIQEVLESREFRVKMWLAIS